MHARVHRNLTSVLEQFSKYANLFFLFTACIQQIPDVSPTNPYTTIVPLAIVLLASAFKEVSEDLARTFRRLRSPDSGPDTPMSRNVINPIPN